MVRRCEHINVGCLVSYIDAMFRKSRLEISFILYLIFLVHLRFEGQSTVAMQTLIIVNN